MYCVLCTVQMYSTVHLAVVNLSSCTAKIETLIFHNSELIFHNSELSIVNALPKLVRKRTNEIAYDEI